MKRGRVGGRRTKKMQKKNPKKSEEDKEEMRKLENNTGCVYAWKTSHSQSIA